MASKRPDPDEVELYITVGDESDDDNVRFDADGNLVEY